MFSKSIGVLLFSIFLVGCSSDGLKKPDGTDLKVRVEDFPHDKKSSSSTILIAHGSDGVSAFHRDWAKRLNSWGYNAVVIDHYSLRGIGMHTGKFLHGVRGEDRAADMLAAAKWTSAQPWHKGKIGVIGFSQGGGGVLALVNNRTMRNLDHIKDSEKNPISASVAFYPACLLSAPPEIPSMPTQLHLAEKDDLAFIYICEPRRDPAYDVIIHKNATHAFDVYIPSGARLTFTHRVDSGAIELSQKSTREFLDKHIRQ